MQRISNFNCFLLLCTLLLCVAQADKLKMVAQLFRHGARSPLNDQHLFPSPDEVKDSLSHSFIDFLLRSGSSIRCSQRLASGSCSYLETRCVIAILRRSISYQSVILTPYSKMKTLPLSPQDYDPDAFLIRSTDLDRTLMSATSYINGLYPLGTGPMINQNLPVYLSPTPILISTASAAGSPHSPNKSLRPYIQG